MKFPKACVLLLVPEIFFTSEDQRSGNQSKLFRIVENKFTSQKTEFEKIFTKTKRSNLYNQYSGIII